MEVYVARQPIFDSQLRVFAYELLFRSGNESEYKAVNGDLATVDVIANSFLLFGMEALTGGKRAFINFTYNLLRDDIAAMLPKDLIVVEVLEDVNPDPEIIAACQSLKQQGYLLALDDFVFSKSLLPLIEIADIIKIDFVATPPVMRKRIVEFLSPYGVEFLAEKVETLEEFQQAVAMGYSYFQGYFFSRPVTVTSKDVQGYKINYLKILQEVHRLDFSFAEIEEIIKRDLSLSYKLLKFINSSLLGLHTEIHSIKHALVLLGKKEITKWVSLIMLREASWDKPNELVVSSVTRAKFGELIAVKIGWKDQASNIFLMGMLSLIDVLVGRPLGDILSEISIDEDIKIALLGGDNDFRRIYNVVVAYERGDWEAFSQAIEKLPIAEERIPQLYFDAVKWTEAFTGITL